jgi:cobalt/nickel transport system ATP-binding protein
MTVPALEMRALTYVYPDGHRALADVDFRVQERERVALLGPNGAGKTTLALHCNGILEPTTGTVHVGGLLVEKRTHREVRRRVGMVFQDPDDQLFMATAREDVAFGPANFGIRGSELDDRVHAALRAVGMDDYADRAPHHLSFGQRRRIALATVLVSEPEILVLDEPSANLDPASRREFADIVAALDVTLLLVTHDLPYAYELCDRAVIIDDGAVVADGRAPVVLADDALLAAHRLELPRGFHLGAPSQMARPAS